MTREPDYKRETLQTAEERAGDTVPRSVADRLESRVATLEAALREIDRNGPPTESLSDFADKYTSDNMGDVFDAGVSCGAASAGAIAREALEAKP